MKLRVLDLFSGIGGFSRGLELCGGFRTVAMCENDKYARRVLSAHWRNVRIYEDVRDVTAARLRADGIPRVDVVCGGFPCQDASVANVEGAGTAGERTGLYTEIVRLASELDAELILMENVTNLLNRGFGDVLGALAEVGFDAEWECFSARELGFDHERERLFIAAYPQRQRRQGFEHYHGILGRAKASLTKPSHAATKLRRAMVGGERLVRGGDGLSVAMDRRRLHALGNAVIPQKVKLIGNAILASRRAA
jgi:DNA (cytosine-5)-methyltransferase 1